MSRGCSLAFVAPPGYRQVAAAARFVEDLLRQTRLADARLTTEHDQATAAFGGVVEGLDQLASFFVAANQRGRSGMVCWWTSAAASCS